MVPAVQQCKSAIIIPASPPSGTSLPSPSHPSSRSSQNCWLGPLCYVVTSHQLSVLHMVYIHVNASFSMSHPLLPLLCPQVCSLYLHLHSFPANRSINIIFLDFLYICINRWYLFFSFWLIALCITGSKFIKLELTWLYFESVQIQMDSIHSFLWLSNIPLYTCTSSSLSIHLAMDI